LKEAFSPEHQKNKQEIAKAPQKIDENQYENTLISDAKKISQSSMFTQGAGSQQSSITPIRYPGKQQKENLTKFNQMNKVTSEQSADMCPIERRISYATSEAPSANTSRSSSSTRAISSISSYNENNNPFNNTSVRNPVSTQQQNQQVIAPNNISFYRAPIIYHTSPSQVPMYTSPFAGYYYPNKENEIDEHQQMGDSQSQTSKQINGIKNKRK